MKKAGSQLADDVRSIKELLSAKKEHQECTRKHAENKNLR